MIKGLKIKLELIKRITFFDDILKELGILKGMRLVKLLRRRSTIKSDSLGGGGC